MYFCSMPIYLLDENIWFPDESEYEADIVAVGGDLSPERLITAYSMGIFPWYNEPGNLQWWCPVERCVAFANEYKPSHSMRNVMNKGLYTCTINKCFRKVIEACREGDRVDNTWIHDEVVDAYCNLHQSGWAHSIEVWQGKELVGGLYGIQLGHAFFGESMFSRKSNASKMAYHHLMTEWNKRGYYLVDCQVHNEHLESLGAVLIDRSEFLQRLRVELKFPTAPLK